MIKRLLLATLIGALLGVFCIVGASLRYSGDAKTIYLFSFWYNRLLMGFVLGLIPSIRNVKKLLFLGLALGLFVSFAFYSSTGFYDHIGFAVGGVYGMIIMLVLYRYDKSKSK